MSGPILAFGASGSNAGLVTRALAARNVAVRGFVRDDKGAERARANGATEIAIGDLADCASLERALDGVGRVFYMAPTFLPDEAMLGVGVVEACRAAGVERLVFSSVIHPVLSGLVNHAAKAPVEEAVLDAGMDYAFLHPTLFFQNFRGSWPKIVETSVLAEPWSSESRFSRVDFRDVAEVAALALTEEWLLCGTYQLCAEGWLNRRDVAALIGEVLGREIRAERIDPGSLGDDAAAMPAMFAHYDRTGLRGSPVTLRAIMGREPGRCGRSSRNWRQTDSPASSRFLDKLVKVKK